MNSLERLELWREQNPEKVKEAGRRYREEHREELRIKNRERYHNNKEAIKARRKELMTPEKTAERREWRKKYDTERRAEIRRRRRSRRLELLASLKEGKACVICGEDRQCVLDFHHVNKDNKKFSISAGPEKTSIDRIREEVSKCVLLCANCHRVYHWEQRNLPESERTIRLGYTDENAA